MATNAELLAEAEAAYHLLVTGRSVREFVDQNNERVVYTSANTAKLMEYIVSLGGPTWRSASASQVGPLRVRFS